MQIYDMIIIGGGPAGYTAALYGARAGMQVIVLEKLSAGGQMALSEQIDNYPGFEQGIDGFELGEKMQQQAQHFGAETALEEVVQVDLDGKLKQVHTTGKTFVGKTVLFATGANPKKLGLPEEKMLVGKGLHYCAACDGMFYRNKTVVVVGGGNSAAADALLLSRVAQKVILVHRRDRLRATKVYHEPLMKAENVEFIWNSTVSGTMQDGKVTGVQVENIQTGEGRTIPCDGLFVSIGRTPATELVSGKVELDEQGYIVADESTRTSCPGVFAAGDVRTKVLRQVVTAVADGATAVHFAEEYLAENPFV